MNQQRATLGGWLAISFIVTSLYALISNQGINSLHAILLISIIAVLPTKLPQSLQLQCLFMQVIGWACFIWAQVYTPHTEHLWYQPITANAPLLVLFGSVSFLRVVAPSANFEEKAPRGLTAFWQTLLGTHLLAAVINMSAGFVMADRLQRGEGLERTIGSIAVRSIAIAAYWSPFFGAMATVLHYLGDIPLIELWVLGIPIAITALLFTWWEARSHSGDQLQHFRGYPISIDALILPISLFITVLVCRAIWSEVPMVTLVAGASLTIPCLLLLNKYSFRQSTHIIEQHITQGLGNLRGEFLLFMSAGVLGAGGSALFKLYPPDLPFEQFTPWVACGLLLSILGLAMLGVHTLVGISISAPLILTLDPDLTLLALCYLSAWSIAAVVSPFSGLSLAFRSRYQLPLSQILLNNKNYGIFILIISMLAFFFT